MSNPDLSFLGPALAELNMIDKMSDDIPSMSLSASSALQQIEQNINPESLKVRRYDNSGNEIKQDSPTSTVNAQLNNQSSPQQPVSKSPNPTQVSPQVTTNSQQPVQTSPVQQAEETQEMFNFSAEDIHSKIFDKLYDMRVGQIETNKLLERLVKAFEDVE